MNDRTRSTWSEEQIDRSYFSKQLETPYESTTAFYSFLSNYVELAESRIVDAACGNASNLLYLCERYSSPKTRFGFDIMDYLVHEARENVANRRASSIQILKDDLYRPEFSEDVDGVTLIQTLSWLDDWEAALNGLAALETQWLALSSLFYEGRIEATIEITSYDEALQRLKSSPYNVYSTLRVEEHLKGLGFDEIVWQPFEIQIDLARANRDEMGTYTRTLDTGGRLQFSGPLHLPWYFLFARKSRA